MIIEADPDSNSEPHKPHKLKVTAVIFDWNHTGLRKISTSSVFRSNTNNLMSILFYLLLFHLILILLVYLR